MSRSLNTNQIYEGDCLEVMNGIPDESVDMILCDLPYGMTACAWDNVIPFEPLWEQYRRIAKPKAAIVLTASQPFTSMLVMSNPKMFKYEWVWDKVHPTGALTAKIMPMKLHENILVFCKSTTTYNRQMADRAGKDIRKNCVKNKNVKDGRAHAALGGKVPNKYADDYAPSKINPKSIIKFDKQPHRHKFSHPTQKPVALFEYLIKTYTNEGDIVLDNCIGSGTTAIAAINANRQWIGIESSPEYVEIANERIETHEGLFKNTSMEMEDVIKNSPAQEEV